MKQLIISLAFCVLVTSFAFSQAKISIPLADSVNWGTVFKGEKITKKFAVKNTGKDTLFVSNVQASCGCTAAMMTEKKIAPGASGELSITFNSENFVGSVHKTVTISSNDTTNPAYRVQFNVNIVQELSIDPASLIFRDLKVNTPSTLTLKIKNTSAAPIKLLSWKSEDKNLELSLPDKAIAAGTEVLINVNYSMKTAGYVNGMLEIATDAPHQSKVSIQFYSNTAQ